MTVRHFKELLNNFNDDDRLVLDNGEYESTSANEVIFAYKIRRSDESEYRPVVILQTKNDFDVAYELEAQFQRFAAENWDEADALRELLDYGFTLEDFKYDADRYEWAKNTKRHYAL